MVLSCSLSGPSTSDTSGKIRIGLYLTKSQLNNPHTNVPFFRAGVEDSTYRCVRFADNLNTHKIARATFYIPTRPEFLADPTSSQIQPIMRLVASHPPAPFRIPFAYLREICTNGTTCLHQVMEPPNLEAWDGLCPMTLVFRIVRPDLARVGEYCKGQVFILIVLGTCGRDRIPGAFTQLGSHFARITIHQTHQWGEGFKGPFAGFKSSDHSCDADHISLWSGCQVQRRERVMFTGHAESPQGSYKDVTVKLGFSQCPIAPERTMVLNCFDVSIDDPAE